MIITINKKSFELDSQESPSDKVSPEVGDKVPLDGFSGIVKGKDKDNLQIELTEYQGQPVMCSDSEDSADGADDEAAEGEMDDPKAKTDLLALMSKGDEEDAQAE